MRKKESMTIGDYLLLPLILAVFMLYPLFRRGVSLLEIFVNKYIRSQNEPSQTASAPAQTLLQLKLLAYERMTLFIERMKPDSLVPRTLSSQFSVREYQRLLVNEIRQEYEYNLSQQLYLSETVWSLVTDFKNNITTLINTAAAGCEPDKPAGELAKKILEDYLTSDIHAEQLLHLLKSDLWR